MQTSIETLVNKLTDPRNGVLQLSLVCSLIGPGILLSRIQPDPCAFTNFAQGHGDSLAQRHRAAGLSGLDKGVYALQAESMGLMSLRQAEDNDVRAMATIKLSNASVFSKVIEPLPDPPSEIPPAAITQHERDIRQRLGTANAIVTVATVQLSDGREEIAGWAMWKIYDEPQPLEDLLKPLLCDDGVNEQARLAKLCLYDFKAALVKHRNAYTANTRNVRLCNLFTHPSYHRRGVGTKLIQQGTTLADKNGYIAFLEASPMGKALYERHGFREIDSFTLDMAKYMPNQSAEMELYTTSIMIRQPCRGNVA